MTVVVPAGIGTSKTQKTKIRAVVDAFYDDTPSAPEFLERIKDATIIVGRQSMPPIKDVVQAAPNLRHIIMPSVGYQNLDVDFATAQHITISNSPTHNSQSVAEHAMTLLMAANRNVVASQTALRSSVWDKSDFSGLELAGRKLALIGYGNIGTRIETIAVALGMQVGFTNSHSTDADLDELLKAADFVCLSVPLNVHTKHLIDARRLALLKPTAILVNVGRGAVIDQAALLHSLKTRGIRAAALDVYEGEPSNKAEPLSDQIRELVSLPNVTATSHIAYNTPESLEKLGEELIATIESCKRGEPINVVS